MAEEKKDLWVKDVEETSRTMDLPEGTFKQSPEKIAQILKAAVLASDKAKGKEFQTAMSMLDFYINRAGKNLKPEDKERLEKAKIELRKLFGKE